MKVMAIGPGLEENELLGQLGGVAFVRVEASTDLLALLESMKPGGTLVFATGASHPALIYDVYARARQLSDRHFIPAGLSPDKQLGWIGPRASAEGICFHCLRLRHLAACQDPLSAIEGEIAAVAGLAMPGNGLPSCAALPWPERFQDALAELFQAESDQQPSDCISLFEHGARRDVRVYPRPNCHNCHAHGSSNNPRSVFDPRYGIVRELTSTPVLGGAVWIAKAEMANSWFSPGWDLVTLGKGVTREAAELSAIGEAVERYTSTTWGRAEANEHAGLSIPIESFSHWPNVDCKSAAALLPQHGLVAAGESFPSGEKCWLPAAVVFLDHPAPGQEGHYAIPNSNGLGAGFNLETATISALLEVIERDALMRAWRDRRCVGRLQPDSLGDTVVRLLVTLRAAELSCELVLLESAGGAATVIALLKPNGTKIPRLSVGCAARLDLSEAAFAATLEAIQVRQALSEMLVNPNIFVKAEALVSRTAIARQPIDHALLYGVNADTTAIQFLVNAPLISAPCSMADRIADSTSLAQSLTGQGYDIYRVDLTTSDIAAMGWRCVRVVSPQLVSLFFGEELCVRAGQPCLHPLG